MICIIQLCKTANNWNIVILWFINLLLEMISLMVKASVCEHMLNASEIEPLGENSKFNWFQQVLVHACISIRRGKKKGTKHNHLVKWQLLNLAVLLLGKEVQMDKVR